MGVGLQPRVHDRALKVDEVSVDLTDDMCPGVMRTRDTTFRLPLR